MDLFQGAVPVVGKPRVPLDYTSLTSQCFWLEWFLRLVLVWEDPGNPVKWYWQLVVTLGNLTSYTWGRWSVWLTSSRSHPISISVPCRRLYWDAIDPTVNSTSHSRHGSLRLCSFSFVSFGLRYFSDSPVSKSPYFYIIYDVRGGLQC